MERVMELSKKIERVETIMSAEIKELNNTLNQVNISLLKFDKTVDLLSQFVQNDRDRVNLEIELIKKRIELNSNNNEDLKKKFYELRDTVQEKIHEARGAGILAKTAWVFVGASITLGISVLKILL